MLEVKVRTQNIDEVYLVDDWSGLGRIRTRSESHSIRDKVDMGGFKLPSQSYQWSQFSFPRPLETNNRLNPLS